MVNLWLIYLVGGGLELFFYFSIYWENVIIPIDELIFFEWVGLNHQPTGMISEYMDPSYVMLA